MIDGPRLPPAAGGAPRSLVVFLHGYGADGNDLIGLGREWAPRPSRIPPSSRPMRRSFVPARRWDGNGFRSPCATRHEFARGVAKARPALDTFLDAELQRQRPRRKRLRARRLQPGHDDGAACRAATQAPARRHPRLFRAPRRPGGAEARAHPEAARLPDPRRPRRPDPRRRDLLRGRAAWRHAEIPVEWHISQGIPHGIGPDGLELGPSPS